MRYILVCSGSDTFCKCYKKHSDDVIYAIDGGMRVINNSDYSADVYIGDVDSLSKEEIVARAINIFSPEKDYSDLELAIKMIEDKYNNEEIIIYNATGMRMDHQEANIRFLFKYNHMNIKLVDDYNEIFVIKDTIKILKDNYKYISFFNYLDDTYITLKGFKYNLDNYKMEKFDNLCLSNEIVDDATVETNKLILCIKSK